MYLETIIASSELQRIDDEMFHILFAMSTCGCSVDVSVGREHFGHV